jgi:5-methylcytosine-specific restriction endonuclease McrBC regulatory subunit McrC
VEHGLNADLCRDIDEASEAWRTLNRLTVSPLGFAGPNGRELCARQYVGIIEVGDVSLEIYPKLDALLIEGSQGNPLSSDKTRGSVMRSLLWMLEMADHRDLAETATAHLDEAPTSFFDLFAYLLGKNLLPELERGVAHKYVAIADNIGAVRGRINLVEQVSRNWNRLDRMSCVWDEFTLDTPINRLFKSACRFLSERVNYSEAARLLLDCEAILSEVADVSPATALREVWDLRFDRSVERFRVAFDLARRLLAGVGHNLGVGSANTFVFLLDMNQVFEDYVHAVLESHFSVSVARQVNIGRLFNVNKGGLAQFADYYWGTGQAFWIGDAKYKHLAKGQHHALRFSDLEAQDGIADGSALLAGNVLSPDDVRQLTVYAELVRRTKHLISPPHLMLLYPFIGPSCDCVADSAVSWNGSTFVLTPVLVRELDFVGNAIQLPVGDYQIVASAS